MVALILYSTSIANINIWKLFKYTYSRDAILTVAHLRCVELELCQTYPLLCSAGDHITAHAASRPIGSHLQNKKRHEDLYFKDKNHLPLLLATELI